MPRPSVSGSHLELIDVRKSFNRSVAVDTVSLAVEPGEFLTLLGPSGSGKTTTLMMIAGFEEPDSGVIRLDGRDITRLPAHRRSIGVVFQNYALFPHMTVFENIAFSLRMRDFSRAEIQQRVGAALDLVQLTGFEARYPRQLSGGQQQRVALARALVFEPSLLLLDEPLGALDRLLREHMQLELRRIHAQLQTTMIYVTHDQEEALVMSDRIAIMNQGHVVQIGSPDDVYERPANRFVAGFIGQSNFLRARVAGLVASDHAIVTVSGLKLRVAAPLPFRENDEVELAIRPEKIAFGTSPRPGAEQVSGAVEDVIYLGEATKYLVRLSEDVRVVVKQQRRPGSYLPRRGDQVVLSWDINEIQVFRA